MDQEQDKEYLTKEKFNEFSKELDYLKKTRRKEIAESLESAKALGDLSENAEYQEAREMQANIEERIAKVESILKNAVIVSPHHSDVASIGSVVVVQKDGERDTRKYSIVGSEEADMANGKVSNHSPLGLAIMGKKKGDVVAFKTPKGEAKYKIIDIE
ncbi:MAG: transcription elongation factor GreA [Candidatus Paceibacterota bacterium]